MLSIKFFFAFDYFVGFFIGMFYIYNTSGGESENITAQKCKQTTTITHNKQ